MDKSQRPLTLLMAAACAWALALLVLALLGLGGRVDLHPASAGQAPDMPTVSLRQPPARLAVPENYLEVGQRPLLNFDRRPAAVAVADAAEGGGELEAVLTSVMITSKLKLAIVRKNEGGSVHRVKLGERVEGTGWTLVSLEPRRALFEGPGGQRALDLRAFDGRGGEAPTTVAAAPAPMPQSGNGPVNATGSPPPPALSVPPPPAPAVAATAPPAGNNAQPAPMTQEQQVEAIRRRIEARRAQMRQEAARAAAPPTK